MSVRIARQTTMRAALLRRAGVTLAAALALLGVLITAPSVQAADRYAAIWEKRGGSAWVARHGLSSGGYQAEFDRLVKQGYRLVHVSGYALGGQDRYAALWEKRGGPAWFARHGLSSSGYQAEFNRLVNQGYRLTHVSGYTVKGQDRYAAIWEKRGGPAWFARHGLTSSGYQSEFDRLVKQGYRLTHVSGYKIQGQDRYAAIWEKRGGGAWFARHGLSSSGYQAEFNRLVKQGYRLTVVSGY